MKNLIKAELFLFSKSLVFKILLFFSFITGVFSYVTGIFGVTNARTIGIDEVIAYQVMPFFNMVFGGTFASAFICGGFKRQTYGLSLSSGNTRLHIFFAKFIVLSLGMFLLSMPAAAVPFAVVLFNGTINPGGGINYILMRLIYALIGFMVQCTIVIFIDVIVKKGTMANIIGISFTYASLILNANPDFYVGPVIGPYVRYTYLYQVEMFMLCDNSFSDALYLAVTVLTFIVLLSLSAWIFVKSELK